MQNTTIHSYNILPMRKGDQRTSIASSFPRNRFVSESLSRMPPECWHSGQATWHLSFVAMPFYRMFVLMIMMIMIMIMMAIMVIWVVIVRTVIWMVVAIMVLKGDGNIGGGYNNGKNGNEIGKNWLLSLRMAMITSEDMVIIIIVIIIKSKGWSACAWWSAYAYISTCFCIQVWLCVCVCVCPLDMCSWG